MSTQGSTPPPGPREPGAARRLAPPTPSAPSRPRRCLPRPGRPALGAGPAGPRPCTPATGQVTSGPRRGRPGPRTAPGTSGGRRQGGRGRRIAPGPGAPAPTTNKQSERDGRQKRHKRRESRGRNCEAPRSPADLENAPCRTAVDPQRLVQCPVERGAVVAELLPEPLLRLSIDEAGRRGVGILSPLLQARCGSGVR
jgi:hypothetical protein